MDDKPVTTEYIIATVCGLIKSDVVELIGHLKDFEPSEGHTQFSEGMVEGGVEALNGVVKLLDGRIAQFGGRDGADLANAGN